MNHDTYEILIVLILAAMVVGVTAFITSCEKQAMTKQQYLIETNAYMRGLMEGSK